MAFSYDRLTEITTVAASSAAAVYTNAASTTAYIRLITMHNTNSSAETVLIYNVPDSSGSVGTAAAANRIYKQTISADDTVTWAFDVPGMVLKSTNDTIQAVTSTAAKVTIQVFGGKE